jgi:hypothetical protein
VKTALKQACVNKKIDLACFSNDFSPAYLHEQLQNTGGFGVLLPDEAQNLFKLQKSNDDSVLRATFIQVNTKNQSQKISNSPKKSPSPQLSNGYELERQRKGASTSFDSSCTFAAIVQVS